MFKIRDKIKNGEKLTADEVKKLIWSKLVIDKIDITDGRFTPESFMVILDTGSSYYSIVYEYDDICDVGFYPPQVAKRVQPKEVEVVKTVLKWEYI